MSPTPAPSSLRVSPLGVVATMLLMVVAVLGLTHVALAQPAPVGLGTAESYAVLAGSEVTNTGPSVINGDLGVQPGSAATGFPPGIVNGTIHLADAAALQAQSDLTIAYDDAAGRACDTDLTGQDLGGLTLIPGVYCFSSSAQLTGTLTLDAQGNPDAPFIFQVGSQITTAPNSTVNLIGATQSCNVFWQVGTTAALDTNTTFRGTIMALTSVTVNDASTIDGRALARNAEATFINDTITRPLCADTGPSPSPTPSDDGTPSPTPSDDGTPGGDGSGGDGSDGDGSNGDGSNGDGSNDDGSNDDGGDGSDDGVVVISADEAADGQIDVDDDVEAVVVLPPNRVETGAGGTAPDEGPRPLFLVGLLGAATVAAGLWRRSRTTGISPNG